MPAHLLSVLLVLGTAPTMEHAAAPVYSGVVIAAPHEGFDMHTAPLARSVAKELGAGWVVARNYRLSSQRRWFDVNRPTQRIWEGGRLS